MSFPVDALPLHGMDFEGHVVGLLSLDNHLHPHEGKILRQVDNVVVKESDTPLASPSRDTLLVVCTAVDADALVAGRFQAVEVVPIRLDGATPVAEIVLPCRSIDDFRDVERTVKGAVCACRPIALSALSSVKNSSHNAPPSPCRRPVAHIHRGSSPFST